MRRMLCTFVLAGMFTLAGSAVFAQDNTAPPPQQGQGQMGGYGRHHRMNADSQLQHLTKQLNLSADQQAQIKPILENRDQQAAQIWQDQSLAPQDRHAKMKALQEDSKSKIEVVLNDSQKQQYEAMQAKMQERMQQRKQEGQAPAPQQH